MGPVLGVLGHDPARNRLVFAAQTTMPPGLGTTWEHDGVAWTQVAANTPHPLDNRTMVWHAARQRLQARLSALPGGTTGDVFEWDGQVWALTQPGAAQRCYDPARDAVIEYDSARLLTTSPVPAVRDDFGSPCGGSRTRTSLTAFGAPRLGETGFHLDVRADAALRPALIGFGLAQANVPLGNGCTLLLQQPLGSAFWFTDAAGFLHLPVALPQQIALRGASLVLQAAVLDPASPGGLALTQGLRLVLGD
jgi:hypothetical protein